ncbi:DNA-processing protein DprA [Actinomadura spongiicola]|uniref:DNA-processing protein DprA n=1 Tax=Actinomadura spongiicola TaxID=2303421 RepID=UPI001313ECC8|nr:DNA-processing protein DprA [Actinomadura spongiicola]
MHSERELEAATLLMLLDAPGIGPARIMSLLDEYSSAAAAKGALLGSGSERVRQYLEQAVIDPYITCLDKTHELGGDFKLWNDSDYPANLRRWKGRPPVLFYKGDLSRLKPRALALVGRVDPTGTGVQSAHRFARKCVEHGIVVVSGLARGIDGESHRGALAQPSGSTYAVLGHGIEHAYPKENAALYAEIPRHGALISQFMTGVGPQRWTFPARNEVMCTLALGTVIVEGKPGCGSLIQADFSFKHDRPVFLLSRNLRSDNAEWAQQLVKRGAHVIERFDQVLEVIEATLDESSNAKAPMEAQTLFHVGDHQLMGGALAQHSDVVALFDLDGVVIDTREATAVALANIASRHGPAIVHPGDVDPVGSPISVLGRLGVRNARDIYRAEYDAELRKALGSVRVFRQVVDGIRDLKRHGIRVGAVTAQPARRAEMLVPREVRQLLDFFLCHNDTGGKKEVGIARVLDGLGVSRDRAFYVGDTPKDLEAARKAAVKSVGVLWGFSNEGQLRRWSPDLLLDDQRMVGPELIRRLFPQ